MAGKEKLSGEVLSKTNLEVDWTNRPSVTFTTGQSDFYATTIGGRGTAVFKASQEERKA